MTNIQKKPTHYYSPLYGGKFIYFTEYGLGTLQRVYVHTRIEQMSKYTVLL